MGTAGERSGRSRDGSVSGFLKTVEQRSRRRHRFRGTAFQPPFRLRVPEDKLLESNRGKRNRRTEELELNVPFHTHSVSLLFLLAALAR